MVSMACSTASLCMQHSYQAVEHLTAHKVFNRLFGIQQQKKSQHTLVTNSRVDKLVLRRKFEVRGSILAQIRATYVGSSSSSSVDASLSPVTLWQVVTSCEASLLEIK